jgi:hypothetical protein
MHRLTERSLSAPWTTLVLALLISAASAVSYSRAPFVSGADALIGEDAAASRELDRFIEQFGVGYPVLIGWSCGEPGDPCESVFDEQSLRMAKAVGDALVQEASVTRVSSIAHTPLLVGTPEGIVAHRFVTDERVDAPTPLVQRALADAHWQGTLVSADGRYAVITADTASTNDEDQVAASDATQAAMAQVAGGFRFDLSGAPYVETILRRAIPADSRMVGGLTGLVVAGVMVLFIRSWQSIASALTTVGLGSLACGGVLTLASWPRDQLTSAAPMLVLVMGTADAIHYLTSYWEQRAQGYGRDAALHRAARATGTPCLMTSLTSGAGMVSFFAADSPAVVRFGAVSAAGVALCLVLTFSLLPVLMRILPDAPAGALRETSRWDARIARVMGLPMRHPGAVLAALLLVSALFASGITRLEPSMGLLEALEASDPVHRSGLRMAERLRPAEGVEVWLSAPAPLYEPGTWKTLAAVENRLAQVHAGSALRSIRTQLTALGEAMGAKRGEEFSAGELLGLAELSDRSALDPWLSLDGTQIHISIATNAASPAERREAVSAIQRAVADLPSGWSSLITGATPHQLEIERVVARSTLQSVGSSVVLVTLLVMLFLRSLKWGLLAMVPNVVPMLVMFGALGWLGYPLDGGVAVVGPVGLGIAVDDTIHLLHTYARERRRGVDAIAALTIATRHCGRAIAVTSLALALGFLTMDASRLASAANAGRLCAITIVSAAIAEMLLLPALVVLLARGQRPAWLRRLAWSS